MRLSDQINLISDTLSELGIDVAEDKSVGETAAKLIRELLSTTVATQAPKHCATCRWSRLSALGVFCQNEKAWIAGEARRGHPVPAKHGCDCWTA